MKKYDKSLLEVWEWKEKVYHEMKDVSAQEYIRKIKDDADGLLSGAQISLARVTLKKEGRKAA